LWNKLINKKLYKIPDCRSIEGLNYAEDFHLTTRLYYYADKIVKIDTPFYHYNKTNENAITHKKNQMHFEEAILFWQLLEQFFKKNNIYEKYFDLIEFHKVQSKLNLIIESHSHKLRKQYAYLYRDIEMKYFSQFRFGEKIILFCTHYRLFLLVRIARNLLVFKNKKIKK
ncbi:MAG: hypothetical protein LBS50_05190, partial [Prevotellaceae bacterium]|jgi:hypothetical protein|nr:hypothetical protein [Prevotellaceae bacterium]